MSYTVQQHHVLQFTRNVEHLLQQMGGKLPGLVSRGSYTGKSAAVVDQVGTIGITRNRARHADTPHVSVPGDRRWVNPTTITTSTLIDAIDDARMLIDLRSPYAQAITEALGRAADHVAFAHALADLDAFVDLLQHVVHLMRRRAHLDHRKIGRAHV